MQLKYILCLIACIYAAITFSQKGLDYYNHSYENLWDLTKGEEIDTIHFKNSHYHYMLFQKNENEKKSNTNHYFDKENHLLKSVFGAKTVWYSKNSTGVYNYRTITTDKKDNKGPTKYYDYQDRLFKQKNYKSKKHVSTFFYDTLGNKVSENYYKNGKRHGVCKDFYPNGNLQWQGSYKEGHMDGARSYKNEDGTPYEGLFTNCYRRNTRVVIVNCIDGHPDGRMTINDQDSLLVMEGEFDNGIPIGTFKSYNNGTLISEVVYEEGEFKYSILPFIKAQAKLDSINELLVSDTVVLGAINNLNENGKKQGYWKVFLNEKAEITDSIDACFFGYEIWDNGEAVYKFEKVSEVYKKYKGNISVHYIGSLPNKGEPIAIDGLFKFFNDHKELKDATIYKNGHPYYKRSFLSHSSGKYGVFHYYYKRYNNTIGTHHVYLDYVHNRIVGWYRKGEDGWKTYRYYK